MRHIRGTLKLPIITFWSLFFLHFIYLALLYGFKKYISLIYLILDIEVLFNIEFTALFTTLSDKRNNLTFYKISLILSIINTLVIFFSIFIIVSVFFVKDTSIDFIKVEPWIETDEKIKWIGVLLIIGKVIDLLPLIILIIYLKRLGTSLGIIDPRSLSEEDSLPQNLNNDDDALI